MNDIIPNPAVSGEILSGSEGARKVWNNLYPKRFRVEDVHPGLTFARIDDICPASEALFSNAHPDSIKYIYRKGVFASPVHVDHGDAVVTIEWENGSQSNMTLESLCLTEMDGNYDFLQRFRFCIDPSLIPQEQMTAASAESVPSAPKRSLLHRIINRSLS